MHRHTLRAAGPGKPDHSCRRAGGDLAGQPSRASLPRTRIDALRIVRAVEEHLAANLSKPIYTEALCAALQVSPRSLHAAFAAVCGMSPHAYLRRRRCFWSVVR